MYYEVPVSAVSAVEYEGYKLPGPSCLIERHPEQPGGVPVIKPSVLDTHGPQSLSLLNG